MSESVMAKDEAPAPDPKDEPARQLSDELEVASRAEADQIKARLRTVAASVGYYWRELVREQVPDDLARQLVVDWHGIYFEGSD